MTLTAGVNHVAVVTQDLDRLIEFYVTTFEAEVHAVLEEGPLRHALIHLGAGMALHPFEVDGRPANGTGEMFDRGHVDHFALNVDDVDTFELLRRRLVENGSSDGTATDFGAVRTVAFRDPDGCWCEIAHWRDGTAVPLDAATVEEFGA